MKDIIERILFEEFPDFDPIKYESVSSQILEPLKQNRLVDDNVRYAKTITNLSREVQTLKQRLYENGINCDELARLNKELTEEVERLKDPRNY